MYKRQDIANEISKYIRTNADINTIYNLGKSALIDLSLIHIYINQGGAFYPSAHGAACMGVGTVADSLAAIEWAVFDKKLLSLPQLRDALKGNFQNNENLRLQLLSAPKYGNNLEYADKYARWYVIFTSELFSRYHTPDGGAVYTAMAANVQNKMCIRDRSITLNAPPALL